MVIEAGLYKVDYRGYLQVDRIFTDTAEVKRLSVPVLERCVLVGYVGGGGSQRKNTQELWLVSFPGKKRKVKRWPPNK